MSFVTIEQGPFIFYAYKPWWDMGLVHGFCGCSADFAKEKRESAKAAFNSAFGTNALFLLRQAHTANVVALKEADLGAKDRIHALLEPEADALTLPPAQGSNVAFGILTADCMPLMVKSSKGMALIHSGWRGLANQVITRTLEILSGGSMEIIIGPCAGPKSYEVGVEVRQAIGDTAQFCGLTEVKSLLDMPQTASVQIARSFGESAKITILERCTINDKNFHSYRRDGERAGRNLAFVIV